MTMTAAGAATNASGGIDGSRRPNASIVAASRAAASRTGGASTPTTCARPVHQGHRRSQIAPGLRTRSDMAGLLGARGWGLGVRGEGRWTRASGWLDAAQAGAAAEAEDGAVDDVR